MTKEITKENIKNYLEGRTNQILSFSGLLSDTIEEQIEYRKTFCNDCEEAGKCVYCGCDYPGRLYTDKSCNNGERFPDLMSTPNWIEFKEQSNDRN